MADLILLLDITLLRRFVPLVNPLRPSRSSILPCLSKMPRRAPSYKPPRYPSIAPLEPYLPITEYIAELVNGTRIRKKIHLLDHLLIQVNRYGPYTLRKLILRFTRSTYDSYYYPYQIHNIVLDRIPYDPSHFRIQFYHYYTVDNQRVDIPLLQRYYDYCALENFLYQHPALYQAFYTSLVRPVFPPSFYPLLSHPPQQTQQTQQTYQPYWTEIPRVSTSYSTTRDSIFT